MSLLQVNSLNLWYGNDHVLKDVSLSLNEGEILCIVGESGSGKSSILHSITRLLPKGSRLEGEILFKGTDITSMKERDLKEIRGKEIGMIFQEPSAYLDPLFSVGSQIMEPLLAHKRVDRAKAKSLVLEAMAKAGIPKPEEKFSMYPHQLSGGLKQRVCIAMSIVCDPDLVLADEPTTALDVSVQKRILSLFRKMKEESRSVILVTHDFGVVAEIGDKVIVLKEGIVVEEGDVYEIFDKPRDPYTKMLLEAV